MQQVGRPAPDTTPAEPPVAAGNRHRQTGLRAATVWSYAQTVGRMAITTGLTLVLAAMLGPRAFGVLAMALVFTAFIEMLQQQGLMPAIISRKELTTAHVDTAFWMVVGVGVVCTTLGVLAAPWWAAVNDTPELTEVIRVLALGIPLTSSVVVHEAVLRRELAFKTLTVRTWVAALAGGAAGITAALLGWGVWALVVQQLAMSVTSVAVLWGVSSWRPRVRFSSTAARELWRYSLRSSGGSLASFVGHRADVVLAGLFFGPVVVGVYRMGQRLTSTVVSVAAGSMQTVSLPGLAAVQDSPETFATRLLGMQRTAACLALPALGVVAGVAPSFELVLGPEWRGTGQVLQLLAVSQAVVTLFMMLGPALQAVGRPGTTAILLWVWTLATVGAVLVAAAGSEEDAVLALCLAVIAGATVAAVTIVVVASRLLRIPVRRIARSWGPGVLGGVAAGGVTAATTAWAPLGAPLADLVLAGLVGTLAAAAAVLAVDGRARRAVAVLARRVAVPRGGRAGVPTAARERQEQMS